MTPHVKVRMQAGNVSYNPKPSKHTEIDAQPLPAAAKHQQVQAGAERQFSFCRLNAAGGRRQLAITTRQPQVVRDGGQCNIRSGFSSIMSSTYGEFRLCLKTEWGDFRRQSAF